MRNLKLTTVFAALLIMAATMIAPTTAEAGTQRYNALDVRSAGMGGAGVTIHRGFSAMLYNPATLAYQEKLRVDVFDFQINVDRDLGGMMKFYDDNETLFDAYNDTTLAAQQKLLDGLSEWDDSWLGIGSYGHLGLRYMNFAAGYYGDVKIEFKTDKGIFDPRVHEYGRADFVFAFGGAFELPESVTSSLLPNPLHAGAVLKIVERYELRELRLSASEVNIDDAYDTLVSKSDWGFGMDLGFKYDLKPDKVTLGMRIQDLVADIGEDRPPVIVNIGASMRTRKGVLLAADFNDVFFHDGENLFNKLHFGAEMGLSKVFTVRAGVGQGYPSIGLGVFLGVVEIDGAMFGTERSENPGGDGEFSYAGRLRLGF